MEYIPLHRFSEIAGLRSRIAPPHTPGAISAARPKLRRFPLTSHRPNQRPQRLQRRGIGRAVDPRGPEMALERGEDGLGLPVEDARHVDRHSRRARASPAARAPAAPPARAESAPPSIGAGATQWPTPARHRASQGKGSPGSRLRAGAMSEWARMRSGRMRWREMMSLAERDQRRDLRGLEMAAGRRHGRD